MLSDSYMYFYLGSLKVGIVLERLKFTDGKIIAKLKLKVFFDNKYNGKMIISVSYRIENILGRGENAEYKAFFFLFPTFSNHLCFSVVKIRDFVTENQNTLHRL